MQALWKHARWQLKQSDNDEEILADVAANFFRGIEGVGGRLKITSHRVLFEANEINLQEQPGDILGSESNLQQQPAEILLSDIAEVSKRNTMGIIPNGLLIRTKVNVIYKLQCGREES